MALDSRDALALDSRDPLPPVHLLGNSNYLQRYLMEPGQGQESIMDHDPLQFTATLTFSSQAEHALLESLTDAAEMFLQRLPTSDDSPLSNDSTGSMPSPLEPSVQPYPENPGLMQKERQAANNNYPFFMGKQQQQQQNYNSPPHQKVNDPQLQQLQIQVQLQTQQQQMNSDTANLMSSFPNGIDLTPSSLGSPGHSLPSPVSPENLSNGCGINNSGPASVTSSRRESSASDLSSLPNIIRDDVQGCLTERVSCLQLI